MVNTHFLKNGTDLKKKNPQSLKLYKMCTLGEVCVDVHMQCVRITYYRNIETACAEAYGNDDAVLGKI